MSKLTSAKPVTKAAGSNKPAAAPETVAAPTKPVGRGRAAPAPAPAPEPEAPKGRGKVTKAAEKAPVEQAEGSTERLPAGEGVALDPNLIPQTEIYDRKVVAHADCTSKRETSIDGIYARLAKKPIVLRDLIIAIDADPTYQSVRRSANPANLITRVRDAYTSFGMLIDA